MSWKDKLNKFIYPPDDETDYPIDDTENPSESDDMTEQEAPINPAPAQAPSARMSVSTAGSSIEMKVVKPEKLESVTQIADQLLARKTILLNLEETNKETSRRLIDFLNGVAYAIAGTLKKVANNTYVITPSNVEVSGEQLHDTQDKGPDTL